MYTYTHIYINIYIEFFFLKNSSQQFLATYNHSFCSDAAGVELVSSVGFVGSAEGVAASSLGGAASSVLGGASSVLGVSAGAGAAAFSSGLASSSFFSSVASFSPGFSSFLSSSFTASSFTSVLAFLLFFSDRPLNLNEFFSENFFFFFLGVSLAASPSGLAASPSAAGAGSMASPAPASASLAASAEPLVVAPESPSALTSPLVLTCPFSWNGRRK